MPEAAAFFDLLTAEFGPGVKIVWWVENNNIMRLTKTGKHEVVTVSQPTDIQPKDSTPQC